MALLHTEAGLKSEANERRGAPVLVDTAASPVWVDPERMSGAPCFVGTRVPIKTLWDHLEAGDSLDEFLDGFPGVSREQAVAVLELARQHLVNSLVGS